MTELIMSRDTSLVTYIVINHVSTMLALPYFNYMFIKVVLNTMLRIRYSDTILKKIKKVLKVVLI
ncbi:MAG: hypothetical protein K0R16_2023 [Nitrososphaeraceae archaeon]|jgi:hypothetical protein|nr:hypothetical protein [Nitrososphaeraceae archaeon]